MLKMPMDHLITTNCSGRQRRKPLQTASDCARYLVVIGRSLEVPTCRLTQRMIQLKINVQSSHNTKHGFAVLENRLPDFEVVATASKSDATAADNGHLQRVLHATGL